MEYRATALRGAQLGRGAGRFEQTYDATHLRAIHRYLFQDVYARAGQYRTVELSKGLSTFAVDNIERYLADAQRIIAEVDWPTLTGRDTFAEQAAAVFAYINQAHPFREGNGRAAKVFMQHLAALSPWRITYDPAITGITPEVWNQASELSGPDLDSYQPVPASLVPVFVRLARPRS